MIGHHKLRVPVILLLLALLMEVSGSTIKVGSLRRIQLMLIRNLLLVLSGVLMGVLSLLPVKMAHWKYGLKMEVFEPILSKLIKRYIPLLGVQKVIQFSIVLTKQFSSNLSVLINKNNFNGKPIKVSFSKLIGTLVIIL